MTDLILTYPTHLLPAYDGPHIKFFDRLTTTVVRVEAKGNGKGRDRTYIADVQVVNTGLDVENDILNIEDVKKDALMMAVGDNLTVDDVEWSTERRWDNEDDELVTLVGFAQIELNSEQANDFLIAYHKAQGRINRR